MKVIKGLDIDVSAGVDTGEVALELVALILFFDSTSFGSGVDTLLGAEQEQGV